MDGHIPDAGESRLMVVLAVVGVVAGIVGAVAALLVFFIPAATDDTSPATGKGTSTSTGSGPGGTSSAASPSAARGEVSRYLTDLDAVAGSGSAKEQVHDLVVVCPTNESGDRFRDISYELPAAYSRVSADVTVGGTADPEATAAVQVFTTYRQNISDRQKEAGRVVLKQGASGPLTAPLADATALTLRVTCRSSTQAVTISAARITR